MKVLHRSKNLTGFIRYQAKSLSIIRDVACNTLNYAGLTGLLSLLNTNSNDHLRAGRRHPKQSVFAIKDLQWERGEHKKIDYSDPFVQALLSPVIIGRLKEILAEGD